MENKIAEIIEKSGLQPAQAKPLLDNFGDFFVQAHKIVAKSKAIKVTSEDQVEEMKKAKELRRELQKIRVDADKVRVELKEGYLRGGQAVQDIFNDIRDIIKPEEDRLAEQEKFAEIAAEKREQEKFEKRVELLRPFVADVNVYDIKNMSEESFEILLKNAENEKKELEQATKKADEDRIAREKAEAELQKKNEEERLRLAKENEAKEKALADEVKRREELEAKMKADQEAREKEEEEKAERKRQILRAPDKEKLLTLAKEIEDIQMPTVISPEARNTIESAKDLQKKFANFLRARANNL